MEKSCRTVQATRTETTTFVKRQHRRLSTHCRAHRRRRRLFTPTAMDRQQVGTSASSIRCCRTLAMHATEAGSRRNVSRQVEFCVRFSDHFSTNIVDVIQSNAAAPVNGSASPGLSQDIIDQIQRPSVDSLLDELSNARSGSPVYAVPHETADGKPKAGRHVTITVRETTTERVAGEPSQCEYRRLLNVEWKARGIYLKLENQVAR